MKTFHVTVAKVGENLFDGEALSVSAKGSEGVFQILSLHEAFVTELVPGKIQVKDEKEETHIFEIPNGGVIEVSNNQATIIL